MGCWKRGFLIQWMRERRLNYGLYCSIDEYFGLGELEVSYSTNRWFPSGSFYNLLHSLSILLYLMNMRIVRDWKGSVLQFSMIKAQKIALYLRCIVLVFLSYYMEGKKNLSASIVLTQPTFHLVQRLISLLITPATVLLNGMSRAGILNAGMNNQFE